MAYIAPLAKLIEQFAKMPGIGSKTAARLAFFVLNLSSGEVLELSKTIKEAKENVKFCSVCKNLTDVDPCFTCCDDKRDKSIICVVESARDVIAIEKTKEFKGVYHVLGGVISPMDNIGPEQLYIKELLARISNEVKEVIVATNPTVEGEATAIYIARLMNPFGVKTTRIAYGIPMGADLEYADEITLGKALEGRKEI